MRDLVLAEEPQLAPTVEPLSNAVRRSVAAPRFRMLLIGTFAGSALLLGTARAMAETFGSTAHGAGRTMSRAQAKRQVRGDRLVHDLAARGIVVRAASLAGVAEEAGLAYKDLGAVVDVLGRLDLSRRVASLTPIGNVKG